MLPFKTLFFTTWKSLVFQTGALVFAPLCYNPFILVAAKATSEEFHMRTPKTTAVMGLFLFAQLKAGWAGGGSMDG